MQLRSEDVAFLVWSLGCSSVISIWVLLSIILRALVLSFWPSISWRRSVRCFCAKIAFLCGVVCSTTCLIGWEDTSRSSVSLIIYIASFGVGCNFVVVGVRVCLGTTIFVVVGTIYVISRLFFLSFELTTLVLIVTWFLTMVARWSGLLRVLLWGLLRHSVDGHFIWGFQTI